MYGPPGYDAGPPPGMHGGPRGAQYGMRGSDIGGPRHGRGGGGGGGGGYGKRGYDTGRNKASTRLPELHSIHQVEILNAFHDGIFVRIPGFDADGLIHHSQISRNLELTQDTPKVERFRQIEALVGDIDYNVYVKVVYVADLPDHLKCECSLKMVSQRDGRDLDEDHSMWLEYMRKRRIRGAGSFTAPNMRTELDRVARSLGEHVTPGNPRSRYHGTPNSALEKPVLRPSDMRAPKSERRRLHASDAPPDNAPMPLPAAMRPTPTNGGRNLDGYAGGQHDWPPVSGYPAAHDQRYDVAPQYAAPPPSGRSEPQGFPEHERMGELGAKPDSHYAQEAPRHVDPRSVSPHDVSAYPPRAAAASDDTLTDVAYGSSTAKHPPPDVAFQRGDHSPPIALGDVSGLPAPSSGDAYQSAPPGRYNDRPADSQVAAPAANSGGAPPAAFNMLPEEMKAMISQMVEQKANEQVAAALAEEKRKRKKRSRSDRGDGDDDAPRRGRRERSRSRSP